MIADLRLTDADIAELADALSKRLDVPSPTEPEPWRLLSADEVAARLGRSTRWVRDRAKCGELAWVRLDGGALAFDLADVQAFAAARRVAP